MYVPFTDYASTLLCEGQGACFVVSPASGDLAPFSTASVKVTAYSNMWGEYRDQLTCKVSGVHVHGVTSRMCSVLLLHVLYIQQ